TVTAIVGSVVTLRNDGSQGNQAPGTIAPIGNLVSGGAPSGADAVSNLTLPFTMPVVGATANAIVDDPQPPFAPGQWVFVEGAGYLIVVSVTTNTLTLRNDGTVGNLPPGSIAPVLSLITGGGPGGTSAVTYLAADYAMPAVGTTTTATVVDNVPPLAA